jgi:hypothetical protein
MKKRFFRRNFFLTHCFSLKLRNGNVIAVRIGPTNKKMGHSGLVFLVCFRPFDDVALEQCMGWCSVRHEKCSASVRRGSVPPLLMEGSRPV